MVYRCERGSIACAEILLELGAKSEVKNDKKKTPFSYIKNKNTLAKLRAIVPKPKSPLPGTSTSENSHLWRFIHLHPFLPTLGPFLCISLFPHLPIPPLTFSDPQPRVLKTTYATIPHFREDVLAKTLLSFLPFPLYLPHSLTTPVFFLPFTVCLQLSLLTYYPYNAQVGWQSLQRSPRTLLTSILPYLAAPLLTRDSRHFHTICPRTHNFKSILMPPSDSDFERVVLIMST